jgi:fimbrial chaperone protein
MKRRTLQRFRITPPLYVLKPASESAVKMMFNGKALPAGSGNAVLDDGQSHPQQAKSGAGNTLQFASANRIKVFYRPEGLSESRRGVEKLAGAYRAGKVTLSNPTPYYLTTINVKIDGMPVQPVMVPPKAA